MLTTPTLHTLPDSRSAAPPQQGRELLAVAAAAALAQFPLLARHAAWLWERPHYQFFPIVVVGAGVLAFSRLRSLSNLTPGSLPIAAAGLAAAWACLAAADVLGSGWLACIAFMTLLMALVHAAGGWNLCRAALPAWVLLWLVVPPPFDLDRLLTFKLQNVTTEWSSSVLDLLGIYHVRTGNVIEVDGKNMMVEQACSGVNSLYSLLACTLFLVLLTRRGWRRGGLLVAAAVAWVLAANVARVTAVVVLDSRWGLNVSTGWRHELLGVLMFAAAVALLVSTDQFFTFLTRKEIQPGDGRLSSPAAAESLPPAQSWRRLAAVGVPAYLLLAIAFWSSEKENLEATLGAPQLAAPERGRLPARIGAWEQNEFAVQKRDAYSFYGEYSSVWKYSAARLSATVSIDYPFPNWHDLTWCYTARGWHINGQSIRSDGAVPGGFLEVRLDQPIHRFGYLHFCEMSARGEPLLARPGGLEASFFRHQATFDRIKARLGLEPEPLSDPAGPVYQFQLFVESYEPLSHEEEAAARDLFARASAAFREFCARQH